MPEELHGRLSIFVNGRARQVAGQLTLGELAADCRLDPKRLLVELNGKTLPREEWPAASVAAWRPGRIYPGGGGGLGDGADVDRPRDRTAAPSCARQSRVKHLM